MFDKIIDFMSRRDIRFWTLVAFLGIVFLTGGGSRNDILSLVILRPISVLACAIAISVRMVDQKTAINWQGRLMPVYFLLAVMMLCILQLIPLPPAMWQLFPHHQPFAEIARLAGIEQVWRPATLSPSGTMNSLFFLFTPIAGCLLYLNIDRRDIYKLFLAFIAILAISAGWALLQIIGPSNSPFYLYRITNEGGAVGLFANRNHQSVLLAVLIAMLGWDVARRIGEQKGGLGRQILELLLILLVIPIVMITGSRAGLILLAPAIIFTFMFIGYNLYLKTNSAKTTGQRGSSSKKSSRLPWIRLSPQALIILLTAGAIVAVSSSSVLLSRSLAFDRLVDISANEGLRAQILPSLLQMAKDYFPAGSGLGTFEPAYKIFEPTELLRPNYLNQAHNDWLQVVIEGGAPLVVLIALGLLWVISRLRHLPGLHKDRKLSRNPGVVALVAMTFLIAASFTDYPLRVPSVVTFFFVMACIYGDWMKNSLPHSRPEHRRKGSEMQEHTDQPILNG